MIRATTGGVMRTYRSNLMNSFINMNASRNTVLTQRTFNSFAEDPAAAAKAFRLRKSRMTVESQHDICSDALKKYQTAVACLQSIDDVLCTKDGVYGQYMTTLTGTTLSMLNDPTGDAREQLSQVLDQMSQSIIQTMNQKYGDNFIFAGADGHNVPFEIRQVDGKDRLFYRGVPVDADIPNVLKDANGDPIAVDENGQIITDPDYSGKVYYLKLDDTKTVPALPDLVHSLDEIVVRDENDGSIKKYTQKIAEDGTFLGYEEDDENGTFYQYIVDGQSCWVDMESYKNHMSEYGSGDQFAMFYEDGCVKDEMHHDYAEYPECTKYICKTKDEEGNDTLSWISIEDYENMQNAQGNVGTQLARVNADGTYNPEGDYYVVASQLQLMTEEEYEAQKLDWEKLRYLANETSYVDIGYGFQEDPVTGKLIESSAFNSALVGINFLGYGLDEDGDPRNVYSLVQRMREVAKSVESGVDWDDDTWNEFNRLVGKFENAVSNYQTEFVDLDASTGKLKSQQELLVDNFDNLQEQYSDIEDVDMVDAITSFIWAEYCYNAALKVGNSILSESLMDYLS